MEPVECETWEGRPAAEWRDDWGLPGLRVFRRVGSTNDLAAELAADGAAEGTVALADEQTAGRGRRGRPWSAPPGSSLSLSMVLRPPGPAAAGLLTLRLGLAAARALEAVDPDLAITLKWPNDLVVEGRKLAGILCESALVDDRVAHVIAGIGINLRQQDDDWPDELAGHAISLAAAGHTGDGRTVDAAQVAGAVISEWLAVARMPRDILSRTERDEFRHRDALRGHILTVDGRPAGSAEGISPRGSLRVRGEDGVREVIAGTVRSTHTTHGGGRT